LAIALRYAARSDVGLVRQNNQDSGYAGPHLLVVCDGMGGHAGGDVASSLAIGELAPLDDESHGPDALEHLKRAVFSAHAELLERVAEEPQLAGMGTTVTALLRTGGRLALAHIGDSRAYLLRDGVLVQITRDHTFVQTLVDEGRLTPEEAEHHPQRSVLMRVLTDGVDDVEPDLSMREARLGDRYLLCSDGLSGVVSFDTLQETLATAGPPAETCETLVHLALRAGAPDNVTCIVSDIVEAPARGDNSPFVVGSASQHVQTRPLNTQQGSPAERAAALAPSRGAADDEPTASLERARPPRRRRWIRRVLGTLTVLVLLAGGGAAARLWLMRQYFVGNHQGMVSIYRGIPQNLGSVHLSSLAEQSDDVRIVDLPVFSRDQVRSGIVADTRKQADQILSNLRDQTKLCQDQRKVPRPKPSVTPTQSPTKPAVSPSGKATAAGSTASKTSRTPDPSPTKGATSPSEVSPTSTPTPTDLSPPLLDCGNTD
jgi:PPM family protein phosphatase